MQVITLDPKKTHLNNPDCPSRLVPCPDGQNWQCVDCGCFILRTTLTVATPAPAREESHPRMHQPSGEWERPDFESPRDK